MIELITTEKELTQVIQPLNFNAELRKDPRLSKATKAAYKTDLTAFECWRGNQPIVKTMIEEYAGELLNQGRQPESVNRALTAIRWWVRKNADYIAEVPADTIEEHLRRADLIMQAQRIISMDNLKTDPNKTAGRLVTYGEIEALFKACENDPNASSARDAAMIAFGCQTGSRRFEITALKMQDIEFKESGADVKITRGKGKKSRVVFLDDGALDALLDWLDLRGHEPGYVFCHIDKGRRVFMNQKLSGESMRRALDKRIEQAGIRPLTWHDLRRSLISELLDKGVDIKTVADIVGHKSVNTTARYDRRDEKTMRKAISMLLLPYRSRKVRK